MAKCDSFLQILEEACANPPPLQEIKKIGLSPYLEDCELARALYGKLCAHSSLPLLPLNFEQQSNGAVPLLRRMFYPWGALPYPKDHAKLALILAKIGRMEIAEKMTLWQRMTLDHYHKPIFSLFLQEGAARYQELQNVNEELFSEFPEILKFPHSNFDSENFLMRYQTEQSTIISAAAGCKSGIGAFLYKDIGVVNYAPQLLPFDDYSGFGLAGRPLFCDGELSENGFHFNFQTRLAAPHPVAAPLDSLSDSGYSALWIRVDQKMDSTSLYTRCLLEGERPVNRLVFSLFGKADSCYVARTHKLNPRSLDRYQGPVQKIDLYGEGAIIEVEAFEGFSKMEIIPLAGDDNFWGADFLITYTLEKPELKFAFSYKER